MKFAHFSDVHIGSWRDPRLRDVSVKAFEKAVDYCISEQVDFILIAGDLFNTSMPTIDHLKAVVVKLKELKQQDIPVYAIAGSHDFSPSGKTMIEVLEKAGLLHNVVKGKIESEKLKLSFTLDKKTGVKLTGMIGKKGMLERMYYQNLDLASLEKEEGKKIFLFHTAIQEFKPAELEKMDASPLSLLPKGFMYYAGGHVHYIFQRKEEPYGIISYPGALFPVNFKELEQFGCGGVCIFQEDHVDWMPIKVVDTLPIHVDCEEKAPQEIEEKIMQAIEGKDFTNTIVLLRFVGTLKDQRVIDINFKKIITAFEERNACAVLKNTAALQSPSFQEVTLGGKSVEDVEHMLIEEHIADEETKHLTKTLFEVLTKEKLEGERIIDFEKRIIETVKDILAL